MFCDFIRRIFQHFLTETSELSSLSSHLLIIEKKLQLSQKITEKVEYIYKIPRMADPNIELWLSDIECCGYSTHF